MGLPRITLARSLGVVAVVLLFSGWLWLPAYAGSTAGLGRLLLRSIGAELRVDSFTLDKYEASAGDSVRATVTVSNVGRLPARDVVLIFWAASEREGSGEAYRLAEARLGAVEPRTRITHVSTFQIPRFPVDGRYRVVVTAESAGTRERNLENNSRARSMLINGPRVASGGATPPVAEPGPPVTGVGVAHTDAPSPTGTKTQPEPAKAQPEEPPAPGPQMSEGSNSSPPPPPSSSGSGDGAVRESDPAASPSSELAGSGDTGTGVVACDYYASPGGGGAGTRPESPFRIQDFWALATAGTTLCLMDGTYQGAASMITPPPGLSGEAGKPIVVRALNDGRVLLDGQFQRNPVVLNGNSWFILEGFNAKNAPGAVIMLQGRANNNIVRRVVAWDAQIYGNNKVIQITNSTGNLVEDSAFFGTSRVTIADSQGGNNTIWRRVWARHEGSLESGSAVAAHISYNSTGSIYENVLLNVNLISMPQSFDMTCVGNPSGGCAGVPAHPRDGQPENPFGWAATPANVPCANWQILGSMVYVKPTDIVFTKGGTFPLYYFKNTGCNIIRHSIAFFHPSHPRFNNHFGFYLQNNQNDPPGQRPMISDRTTSIRGSLGDFADSGWTRTNHVGVTSLAAAIAAGASPWTGTTGAQLCKRWVNGERTNEPLWPWPMNERIKQATASAGAYSGPCLNCSGGRQTRTAVDVTADVEAMLGPIPAQCRR